MASITVTAANVRAMNGSIVRRYTAAEALAPGQPVYLSASKTVTRADGSAVATLIPFLGIVVGDQDGNTTIPSGAEVDVCVFGPVTGISGATAGALVYVSDTVGEITEAAGEATKDMVVGFVEQATVLFIRPQIKDFS